MTAMCDVVFQLLIYLILTAKPMLVFSELSVARPAAEGVHRPAAPLPMLEIMVFKDDFSLCGKRVAARGLDEALQRQAGICREQNVTIKCAPDAAHGRLVEVLNMCGGAQLKRVSVLSM